MDSRQVALCVSSGIGAGLGYGGLAVFVCLVSVQVYRWLRDGEWLHIGIADGLRFGLVHCCVKDGDTGWPAAIVQWLDSPANWLGMHKAFEIVPASLALFALSIVGNSLFIYCRDRLQTR